LPNFEPIPLGVRPHPSPTAGYPTGAPVSSLVNLAIPCPEIFSEQVSAVAQRDKLKEALRFVRRGDSLVACKPDRLARSTTDLLRIVEDLDRRGVGLIMLSMGGQQIDSRSPTGRLMVTMLGAVAEFERGLLLERQKEGVAKAKRDGKYKGRKPTARAKAAEVNQAKGVGSDCR